MRIRIFILTLPFAACISTFAQQPSTASPNTQPASNAQPTSSDNDKSRLGPYIKREIGPKHIAMAGVGAGVNQANDTPSEWGQGAAGFGRRIASAFSKHIVHKAIQYPVSKLLHEELFYQRSNKQGFMPRMKNALVGTVITHKTTSEQPTLAVGEISGAFGSGLISRLWQPASVRTVGLGFASGAITLGVDAGMNVVKEFWPEIRHPRGHASIQAPSPASPADVD
jgi:hypothetical protein